MNVAAVTARATRRSGASRRSSRRRAAAPSVGSFTPACSAARLPFIAATETTLVQRHHAHQHRERGS